MGVQVYRRCMVHDLIEDENTNHIKQVIFKKLNVVEMDHEEEEEEEEMEDEDQNDEEMDDMGNEAEDIQKKKKKRRSQNQYLKLDCKVFVTTGHRDVDPDVFNAIHNNGLVYNGRLIVDKNFQTTDASIFAAGPLCEFSGRYKAISQGKLLRLDRFNGREMGSRLARSVFDIYDPTIAASVAEQSSMQEEELPSFFLPQGMGG